MLFKMQVLEKIKLLLKYQNYSQIQRIFQKNYAQHKYNFTRFHFILTFILLYNRCII